MMRLMLATAALVLVSACGKQQQRQDESQAQAEPSPVEVFISDIQTFEEAQGAAATLDRLRVMLDDPEHAEIRSTVFDYLLYLLAREGRLEDAQKLYMERGGADGELAEAGFRQIMFASMSDDAEASAAWLERLMAGTFPATVRTAAWQQRMAIYADSGSVASAAGRVEEIMSGDLASSAAAIMNVALSQGLRSADLDGVEALLAALRPHAGHVPELDRLVVTATADLLMARGDLEKAFDHCLDNSAVFGDAELVRRFRLLLGAARERGLGALVARVVETAYARGADLPLTRDAVAAWAVGVAVDGGDHQELLDATETAFARGASVARIFPVFFNGFYPAIQTAPDGLRAGLMDLIGRMRKTDGLPEHLQGMMGTALLDGNFFRNDYQSALAIVEEGIAGFDEVWHAELKDKIRAHIALQEGRVDDAVALFSIHMKRVAAWTEPMSNPEDGRPVLKEVVLGFNEKRIGDIWSGVAGREADAKAAYGRARSYYQEALALLQEGTPEHARAVAELAEVPAVE